MLACLKWAALVLAALVLAVGLAVIAWVLVQILFAVEAAG